MQSKLFAASLAFLALLTQNTVANSQVALIYKIYKWGAAGAAVEGVYLYSTRNKAEADEFVRKNRGAFVKIEAPKFENNSFKHPEFGNINRAELDKFLRGAPPPTARQGMAPLD